MIDYFIKYNRRLSPSELTTEQTRYGLVSIRNASTTIPGLSAPYDNVVVATFDDSNDRQLSTYCSSYSSITQCMSRAGDVIYTEEVPPDEEHIDINDEFYSDPNAGTTHGLA